MKRFVGLCLLLSAMGLGVGCSQKTEAERTTTVTTPGGETKTTTTQTIEKSGDNPPPANP